MGFEPTILFRNRILSPTRMPIPPRPRVSCSSRYRWCCDSWGTGGQCSPWCSRHPRASEHLQHYRLTKPPAEPTNLANVTTFLDEPQTDRALPYGKALPLLEHHRLLASRAFIGRDVLYPAADSPPGYPDLSCYAPVSATGFAQLDCSGILGFPVLVWAAHIQHLSCEAPEL